MSTNSARYMSVVDYVNTVYELTVKEQLIIITLEENLYMLQI